MTRRWPALPFLGLYLVLAFTFFALMRDHAYHPTDDGFVLAYSWRIAQGEFPYRDFLYVRTPLSPYLHLAWLALPDGWQIPAGRFAFYLELAAAAFMPTAWAVRRGLRATIPALAVAGCTFLLSLHNFPPMPWPTVDAVFFASAGSTAFLLWTDRGAARWLTLSTVLLTLSTLAKQSFAPMVLLVVAYALVVAWRRRAALVAVAAAVPPAVIGVGVVLALVWNGAFADFIQQISAPVRMRPSADNPWSGDLIQLGIRPYLSALGPGVVPLLAFIVIVFVKRDEARWARIYAAPLAMTAFVIGAVLLPTDTNTAGIFVFLGVVAMAGAAALRAVRGMPTSAPLSAYAVLLAAGWCASLSFAYLTPLLALGMLGSVVALELRPSASRFDAAIAVAALAAVASIVTLINIDVPYRDVPRDAETADLGAIYPRLGHLYTNPVNAERHREVRDLSERFALTRGRDFVVLTAFPLAHYLSGTRNPLSLDWLEPQEYVGNEDRLRNEMLASMPVVLIQRQVGEAFGKGPPLMSCADALAGAPKFAADTLARERLVQEATFFCVYAPD